MTKFRRVNDFKTRFFVKISKFRSIFLPKHFFSQFRILLFFEFRVYDPKSSNRLGLTISKCKFRQNQQKSNWIKILPRWKIVFWRFQQIPKIKFSKNCWQHLRTHGRTDTTENLQFKVTLLVRINKLFARISFLHAKTARKWTFFQPSRAGSPPPAGSAASRTAWSRPPLL